MAEVCVCTVLFFTDLWSICYIINHCAQKLMKIKLTNNAQTKLASISADWPNIAGRAENELCLKGSLGLMENRFGWEVTGRKITGRVLTINRK